MLPTDEEAVEVVDAVSSAAAGAEAEPGVEADGRAGAGREGPITPLFRGCSGAALFPLPAVAAAEAGAGAEVWEEVWAEAMGGDGAGRIGPLSLKSLTAAKTAGEMEESAAPCSDCVPAAKERESGEVGGSALRVGIGE
jgi:hypothetical protein